MLEDLIKLSKELFEMELIKESLEIDSLIHKLYSIGGDVSDISYKDISFETEPVDFSVNDPSLEDIKDIISNSNSDGFGLGLSDILIESLDINELELIKEALIEHLD